MARRIGGRSLRRASTTRNNSPGDNKSNVHGRHHEFGLFAFIDRIVSKREESYDPSRSLLKSLGSFIRYLSLLLLAIFLFWLISKPFEDAIFKLEEKKLDAFANRQYYELFNKDATYENNILFVYVVHDNHVDLDALVWAGENAPEDLSKLFTGYTIAKDVNTKYRYDNSLDDGIASSLNFISIYAKTVERDDVGQTYVKNYSSININESKLKSTLDKIATKMYGDVAIVIVDSKTVYGSAIFWHNLSLWIFSVGIPIAGIIFGYLRRNREEIFG